MVPSTGNMFASCLPAPRARGRIAFFFLTSICFDGGWGAPCDPDGVHIAAAATTTPVKCWPLHSFVADAPLCCFCFSVQMRGFTAVSFLLCLTSAHKSGDVKPKWWTIPEPVATVGKLFYFKVPYDSIVDNTGPINVSIMSAVALFTSNRVTNSCLLATYYRTEL